MGLSFGFGGPPVMGTFVFPNFEYSASRETVIDAETGAITTDQFPDLMLTNPQYGEDFHVDPPINPDLQNRCGSLYSVEIQHGVNDRTETIDGILVQHSGVYIVTTMNLIGIPKRSEVLDQTPESLRAHLIEALMNVAMGPAPSLTRRVDTFFVNNDPTPASENDTSVQGCEDGVYAHHTLEQFSDSPGQITVALAAIELGEDDNYRIRGLGVGIGFDPSDTEFHNVDVTHLVEAYYALDTAYPAFCFFATAPLAENSPVTGAGLAAFMDGLFSATTKINLGVHTWDDPGFSQSSVPTGTVETTYLEWGTITTTLGKAKFDGMDVADVEAYGDLPPVIR